MSALLGGLSFYSSKEQEGSAQLIRKQLAACPLAEVTPRHAIWNPNFHRTLEVSSSVGRCFALSHEFNMECAGFNGLQVKGCHFRMTGAENPPPLKLSEARYVGISPAC